jgi:hypothetical protein
MNDTRKSILRLPKRHAGAGRHTEDIDGGRLVREQSVANAIYAGLIAVILFSILWAMTSTLLNRIFPWLTLLLGVFVGLAVRRAGNGLDWRFPLLAAVITVGGALLGNVVVAAAFTAAELDTSTLHVLRKVTSMTWPVFFDEVMSPADAVYALFGAGIAAFYANRRLSRAEYHALRMRQQDSADVKKD